MRWWTLEESGASGTCWGRVCGLEELVHVTVVEADYELCGLKVNEM